MLVVRWPHKDLDSGQAFRASTYFHVLVATGVAGGQVFKVMIPPEQPVVVATAVAVANPVDAKVSEL